MRILIVGSGFVGTGIAQQVVADGNTAIMCSRHPPWSIGIDALPWTPADATVRGDCVRVLDQVQPDAVVLVHGPSDITWCEAHPDMAMAAHTAATANVAAAACGARIVLVSTDNVFNGGAAFCDEHATPAPVNAYGRAKLQAERVLVEATGNAVLMRVSLVYGWELEEAGKWLNYFSACVHRLRRGQAVEAPNDHWMTPVLLDDVARVVSAVAAADVPVVLHLGGPDRISRVQWAALIAETLGVDPELILPVPRCRGRYACRPVNSCLRSAYLAVLPATRDIRVRGVRDGIGALLSQDTSQLAPLRGKRTDSCTS